MRRGARLVRGAPRRGALAVACVALVAGALVAQVPAGATSPTWTVGTSYAPSMQYSVNVACPSLLDCYAISITSTGLAAVRTTTDGGASWDTSLTTAPGVELNAIACISRLHCVAVDGESALRAFWTTDGGTTWRSSKLPATLAGVASVTCLGGSTCVAVGIDASGDPVLGETHDAGATWRAHTIPPAIASGGQEEDLSSVVACVTWLDCIVAQRGSTSRVVFRTADAGRHWATVRLPRRFGTLSGLADPAGHCAVAGYSSDDGTVATSGNGGRSWRLTLDTTSAGGFYDVACTERGACVAAGATAVGTSWRRAPPTACTGTSGESPRPSSPPSRSSPARRPAARS